MAKRLVRKQPPKESRKRLRTKQSVNTSAAAPAATEPAPAASEPAIVTSKYDDMLRKIYYDVRDGFGSIVATLKEAKNKTQQ